MAMPVRVFERRAVREAVAYAQTGGIALHFFRWSHPHFGTGEYCHVLSSDRDLLIEFGAAYGFPPHLLQPPRRGRGVWHFDAFGWRAIALRRLATKLTADEGDLNREDAEDTRGRKRRMMKTAIISRVTGMLTSSPVTYSASLRVLSVFSASSVVQSI